MKIVSVETFPIQAPPAAGPAYWGARTWGKTDHKEAKNEVSSPQYSPQSRRQNATLEEGNVYPSLYPPLARRLYAYSQTIDTLLVKVRTEDGVVGWGEAKAPVAPRVAAAIVEDLLVPVVVGSRLDEISVTWERMYAAMRVRGHDTGFLLEAISGVDIALWDAWGRTLDQPLWALLGGQFREAIPVYASGIPAASNISGKEGLEAVRQQAHELKGHGYRAIKVAVGVDPAGDVASVRAVREVLGDDGDVYVDAAGTYDLYQALALGKRFEELGVGWFEMPIPPENVEGYTRLASALEIPLALDSIATRHRALTFLRAGALHVVQPDVCRAGGITEAARISALADAFGVQATPHVSIGSAVHFAASLQLGLATPNLAIMEHWTGDNPLGTTIAPNLDLPEAGYRRAVGGAGLGIEVDESAVSRASEVDPSQTVKPCREESL